MKLELSIGLLIFLKVANSFEINVDNASEFWSDIMSFAKSEGISMNSLDDYLKEQKILYYRKSPNLLNSEDLSNKSNEIDFNSSHNHSEEEHHEEHGVKIAGFKFDYVKEPLVLSSFIFVVGVLKLIYHHTRYTKKILPESCCLIILGCFLGWFFIGDETHESVKFLEFHSKTFFFFLLPPIILESAYSLKDRAFIENIGTIVIYAVVGTVLNIALVGGCLLGLSYIGLMRGFHPEPLDTLVFASLIAAVDPVAVLAVFQEVGVNKMLYFMVFGESLLNDAVTIVCYNLANEFKELSSISIIDCLMGIVAFLCVSLGGLAIGLICGAISSFITRFTTHVRVVEPIFLFGMAYLSYMLGELFHFSGIIALIACGLFQTHYAMHNLSYKSNSCVIYFTKVISNLMESLIFIILGVMLMNERGWFWSDWHPLFSVFSIVLCVIVRFIVVYFLTYIINRYTGGIRHISFQEQFIIAYGGLRGAVSFSLAFMIDDEVEEKNTLLAATYMVILFTVFIQGSSIKPLVQFFNIRLAGKDDKYRLFLVFNSGMIDNLSQGIEDLCGYKNYSWINVCSRYSRKYLRPLLEKEYKESQAKKGNKLAEMDKALNIREQMKASASTASFQRQQTIDEFAESGINIDYLDDEEGLEVAPKDQHRQEEIEKQTDELIKDTAHMRMLMQNPYEESYIDRNLVNETEREQRLLEAKLRMRSLQDRMMKLKDKNNKKRIFGRKSVRRKGQTQQGMLMAAMGSIGVHAYDSSDHPQNHHNEPLLDRNRALSSGSDEPITMPTQKTDNDHELYTITEGQDDPNV